MPSMDDASEACMSCAADSSEAAAASDTAAAAIGSQHVSRESHDTISMVALDAAGNVAAASSSNGASHKVKI